jgi:hypothetical protein
LSFGIVGQPIVPQVFPLVGDELLGWARTGKAGLVAIAQQIDLTTP